MIGYFIRGFALGFPAAATPGPFQAYLLAQTIRNGWRKTLLAAFAPLLSDGPIIALVVLVLTQMPDWLLQALRVIGGLFILYLARGAYLSFRLADSQDPAPAKANQQQSLLEATMMNALNPNPYIFWSVVGAPILLDGWRQSPALGLAYLAGFYGTLIGGFMSLIMLFGTAQRLGPKVTRVLSGVSALALLLFGLYQLWMAITTWFG